MKRILIVDPEPASKENLEKLLKNIGYSPDFTTDSVSALTALKNGSFQVMITEIELEYEDSGLILIHHARRMYPEMKIIVFSNFLQNYGFVLNDQTDPNVLALMPADLFLNKRNDLTQLEQALLHISYA